MNKLFMLGLLLGSFSSHATIECRNMSDFFEEDALTINLQSLTGSYFDNDTSSDLVCEKGIDESTIFCTEKGNKNSLMTRIEADGKAVVVYSFDQWVDFQCDL